MKPVYKLIISIAIPLMIGGFAGFVTAASVDGWYSTIRKPSFNPPNAVFAPVWTILYIMMGISFYLLWKSDASATLKRTAIIVYFTQLVLNFFWSFIFFGSHEIGLALVDIILLWIMIIICIFVFRKISTAAALLFVPYLLWVSFATLLNYSIWRFFVEK